MAREGVRSDLSAQGVSARLVEDAALVVTELTGNALRHAWPLPSGEVRVTWSIRDDTVQVAVSDGGSDTDPRAGVMPPSTSGGRGLGIVAHLAEAWGVWHEDRVTTVWAVLPSLALAACT